MDSIPEDTLQKFAQYDPMSYLIQDLTPTDFPNIFVDQPIAHLEAGKPLIIVVIGPSGSGKDTSIDGLLSEGLAVQAITATSRSRRVNENEPEWKYTWMSGDRLEGETHEQYIDRMVQQYDLIEHDFHDGNLYGLPKANIEKLGADKPIVIRTESRGLETIKEKLGDSYNIVSVFVTAPDYKTLETRIGKRNDIDIRMQKAVEEVQHAKGNVNFVLLNPDTPVNPEEGIATTQNSMKSLVESLTY